MKKLLPLIPAILLVVSLIGNGLLVTNLKTKTTDMDATQQVLEDMKTENEILSAEINSVNEQLEEAKAEIDAFNAEENPPEPESEQMATAKIDIAAMNAEMDEVYALISGNNTAYRTSHYVAPQITPTASEDSTEAPTLLQA